MCAQWRTQADPARLGVLEAGHPLCPEALPGRPCCREARSAWRPCCRDLVALGSSQLSLLPVLRRYGFNSGSGTCFEGCMYTASKVAVNTTLSTGAGGLTVLLAAVLLGHPGDIGPILNGESGQRLAMIWTYNPCYAMLCDVM